MANSKSTRPSKLPIQFDGAVGMSGITEVEIVLDSATEFEVFTPDWGECPALVGLSYQESGAHTLEIIIGSVVKNHFEMAANNAGVHWPITGAVYAQGFKNESVYVLASASITSLTAYFTSFESRKMD